ncbi:MAG TPA: FHA domain-containing protein [Pyrinomonadaceae bacterium]
MPNAKIKFNDQEITLGDGATSIGRASDNAVSFANDTNISRYHAEIERRGDEFWLIDLKSSNGTTVNGEPIESETILADGDSIAFGGTSVLEFEIVKESEANNNASAAASDDDAGQIEKKEEAEIAEDAQASSKTPAVLLIAGAVCGLAVICVFAAGLIYYTQSSSACEARAVITSPEPGETIVKTAEIEVETENAECVERAIFTLDGVEFASATEKPYAATLDPKQFPDLADGFEHRLQIVLEDENGNRIVQPNLVALAFETREIAAPSPAPEIVKTESEPPPKISGGKQVSLIDVQKMSERLVKQFGGNFSYNVSNKQFLAEVQKKTAEYAQEGYFERASRYRDAINVAYVQEQNLDAPLGFILAMSRSKFVPTKQGAEESLWRMTNEFVAANAYNGACGAETLSDASQNCAARSSALYMKAIVYGVFDGDPVYSAAAFGKSPQDAGIWKASLPANRADFWNAIKTPQEREQIARFFAAGIVAENPQKFGLKKDRPLSELYRVTM